MRPNYTPRLHQVLALAQREADKAGHGYIGTEHLVMALFKINGTGKRILDGIGADQEKAELLWKRIRYQDEIDALKTRIAKLEEK